MTDALMNVNLTLKWPVVQVSAFDVIRQAKSHGKPSATIFANVRFEVEMETLLMNFQTVLRSVHFSAQITLQFGAKFVDSLQMSVTIDLAEAFAPPEMTGVRSVFQGVPLLVFCASDKTVLGRGHT